MTRQNNLETRDSAQLEIYTHSTLSNAPSNLGPPPTLSCLHNLLQTMESVFMSKIVISDSPFTDRSCANISLDLSRYGDEKVDPVQTGLGM